MAPALRVHKPDFLLWQEVKKDKRSDLEYWVYEINEVEQPITISISSFSNAATLKETTATQMMKVIRPYHLYFADDSLEKVKVGLIAGGNSS